MTPEERANKVREIVQKARLYAVHMDDDLSLRKANALLPPGSIILTAAEIEAWNSNRSVAFTTIFSPPDPASLEPLSCDDLFGGAA